MRFGIFGAGAIGCWIGGWLQHAGHPVRFVGRIGDELRADGLTLTDYEGRRARIAPEAIVYDAAPDGLADAEVVLVTVKSQATEDAGRSLASVVAPGAVVVSFQNGVRNAEVLRRALPGRRVLGGMVPFNVLREQGGRFHRGTSGALQIEDGPGAAPVVAALAAAGLAVTARRRFAAVSWGKLVFNLNNSLNALAGVPLREELLDRGYRRLLADAMAEALGVLRRAGIRPAASGGMLPGLAPPILRLPTPLFRRIAAPMIRMDARARSSMWEDLDRRRATEIDYLNGEIVRVAAEVGSRAPVNAAVVRLVREAEARAAGSPGLSAAAIRAAIEG